jgi:hypothetical protein
MCCRSGSKGGPAVDGSYPDEPGEFTKIKGRRVLKAPEGIPYHHQGFLPFSGQPVQVEKFHSRFIRHDGAGAGPEGILGKAMAINLGPGKSHEERAFFCFS